MKIICIGRNYVEHARELGNEVPQEPIIFMKPPSALLVNDKPLYYPDFTDDLHYELELVLKICKNGKSVQPEFAHRYYEEIALGIDFTARDIQSKLKAKGHPWEKAKGFDGSAVLSPFRPLMDYNREKILFSLKKNGNTVQEGDTSLMIFNFNSLVCHITKYFKLQMGDLIYTGTPAGVGPVKIGDVLEGFLEGDKLLHCEIR
jgi:2-keto-4-pentenoate hydratase/2-oxohepta-3-ene-1,7-dioic acid hydratase in catechol pathway